MIKRSNVISTKLSDAIASAFSSCPLKSDDEIPLVKIIHAQPGISNSELVTKFGRGHVNLVLAFLISHRKGIFSHVTKGVEPPFSVLVTRSEGPKGVTYTLAPEFEEYLKNTGVV